jgi:septal ring factor EnvC (AmiA/AmiB activator)
MTETFWEPGVEEQSPAGSQLQEQATAPGSLALSSDDFKSLEERILRAVDMVKRERLARTAAEERATQAEAQLHEQAPRIAQLEKELHTLHTERNHVRQRIERLLAQLDALEL